MFFESRLVSLFLALLVSIITTLVLYLTVSVSSQILILTAVISFVSCFILVYLALKILIFNEIRNISNTLENIQKSDFNLKINTDKNVNNPLKKVNQEILYYAQRRQNEYEELKRMEVYRKEFIADVSHELKTPLFAAQGFVHTLLDGAIKDSKVRNKFLKKAAKSLTGLEKLVQDLLTISQIEAGTLKMQPSVFDLVEMVREVIDQFEGKADKKDMELCFSKDCLKQAYVFADRQRISQVFLNILSNAVKYTGEKGSKIMIDLKDAGEFVSISIHDDGIGIPAKDINRIFERFYRVDKSRSKDRGGTGLDLSIVKHILEAHKQTIKVESTVGVGSTFTFKLPKAVERGKVILNTVGNE